MRRVLRDIGSSIVLTLTPAAAPVAVASAVRTLVVAGSILVVGQASGDLDAVGVAYLGTACAVAFVQTRTYLSVITALLGQAVGAILGFGIAAFLPDLPVVLIASAAVAGLLSGMLGSTSPAAPGFGMMLSIGLAFGQFADSPLSWWSQCAWYLVGTAAVGAVWLSPWLFDRRRGSGAASVFEAAADLCEALGGPDADGRRAGLAAAWAAAGAGRRNVRAELSGFAAAALYAEGTPVPPAAVAALRAQARRERSAGAVVAAVDLGSSTPGLVALTDALSDSPVGLPGLAEPPLAQRARAAIRLLVSSEVLSAGARLGVCMGVSTGVSVALHGSSHSFWLPLTVAVIMRPEYASIFVRTVNRVFGTVVGAVAASAILFLAPPGTGVAVGAACALAFSVLMAPKLYGLNVIGVTCAALLASSIGSVDDALPMVRLGDTALGALIAVVIGHLLWPGARRFSGSELLRRAVDAAQSFLAAVSGGSGPRLQQARDDAYRSAHVARTVTERALAEPAPVNRIALQQLPYALQLERIVDDISGVAAASGAAARVDAGALQSRVKRIADEIDSVRRHCR